MRSSEIAVSLSLGLVAWTLAAEPESQKKLTELYPAIEPFETGFLKVSDVHEIYYELSGNPKGRPAMLLHGGPGGGSRPPMRRYHHPAKWLIVLHDQRGAGKSKPSCELKDNHTQALVEDIERLRTHLKLDKVQIWGGSWGATLGLAYAESYPENVSSLVLRGVFTATKSEIDHFYHGGVSSYFPEVFADLRALMLQPETLNYPQQLLSLLQSDDAAVKRKASLGWARYEIKISRLDFPDAQVDDVFKEWNPYDFSLIENHYMANRCFLEEGQLLQRANKIAHIPTVIVQGRYDVVCPPITAYQLHKALPKSKLMLVESAGHSASEPGIRSALIEAVNSLD